MAAMGVGAAGAFFTVGLGVRVMDPGERMSLSLAGGMETSMLGGELLVLVREIEMAEVPRVGAARADMS